MSTEGCGDRFDSFAAPSEYVVEDSDGKEIVPTFINQMEVRAIRALIGRDIDFLAAIGRLSAHIFQDGIVFYRGKGHVMNDAVSRRLQSHFRAHGYRILVDQALYGMTLYAIEPDEKVGGIARHIPLEEAFVGFITDQYANRVFHVWFGGVPRSDIKVIVFREPMADGRIDTEMTGLMEIKRMSMMFDRALLRSTISRLCPVAAIQSRTQGNPVSLPSESVNRIADALAGESVEMMMMNSGQTSRIIRSRAGVDAFLDARRSHGTVANYGDNLRQVLEDTDTGETPRVIPVDGVDRTFISSGEGREMHPLPPALPPQNYPLIEERMSKVIARIIGYPRELWAGTVSTYKKDLSAIGRIGDTTAREKAHELEVAFNRFSEEVWSLREDASDTPKTERGKKRKDPNAGSPPRDENITERAAQKRGAKKNPQLDPDADASPADEQTPIVVAGSIEEVEPFLLSAYSYRDLNVRVKIGFVVRKELQERSVLASTFGIRQALPWMDTDPLPVSRKTDRALPASKRGRPWSLMDNLFYETAPRREGPSDGKSTTKLYLLNGDNAKGKPKPRPINPARQARRITDDPRDEEDDGKEDEGDTGVEDNSQLNASD